MKIGGKTNIVIKNSYRNRINAVNFSPHRDRKYIEVKITNTTLCSFPIVFHEATPESIILPAWLRAVHDGEAHVRKNTHLLLLLNTMFCFVQVPENLLKTLVIL